MHGTLPSVHHPRQPTRDTEKREPGWKPHPQRGTFTHPAMDTLAPRAPAPQRPLRSQYSHRCIFTQEHPLALVSYETHPISMQVKFICILPLHMESILVSGHGQCVCVCVSLSLCVCVCLWRVPISLPRCAPQWLSTPHTAHHKSSPTNDRVSTRRSSSSTTHSSCLRPTCTCTQDTWVLCVCGWRGACIDCASKGRVVRRCVCSTRCVCLGCMRQPVRRGRCFPSSRLRCGRTRCPSLPWRTCRYCCSASVFWPSSCSMCPPYVSLSITTRSHMRAHAHTCL